MNGLTKALDEYLALRRFFRGIPVKGRDGRMWLRELAPRP